MASGLIAILIFPQKVSVPGTWFLEPDACNGAAVHASLLPSLFQESGIRCQGSGVRMTLGPISLRPTMPARVWQGSCFLIPDS